MSEVNKVLETEVNDQSTILEEMGYKQELKRVIKTRDVALYGIIYACPIAGFLLFGYVYEMAHGMVFSCLFDNYHRNVVHGQQLRLASDRVSTRWFSL